MELKKFQEKPLEKLCDAIIDCPHSTPEWEIDGFLVLRNQNIKGGKLDLSEASYTNKNDFAARTQRAHPKADDLVITREAPMGEVCIIPNRLECCLGQRMVLLRPKFELVIPKYLLYAIQSQSVQDSIRTNGGTGSTVSNLRIPVLSALKIPIPDTKAEQQAIASALSDADELIESLEQLLAKKRNLKQGAMQELLTGKRRLAGFGAPWSRRKLGELLTIRHGKSQHHVESSDGTYPILATGGQIGWATDFLYDKPSVLIGRKGTIDKPQYMNSPFWTVDTLFYSEIADGNSEKFLYYRFCLIDWKQHNEASGVPSLSAKTIENIEILCPESEEQTAIAAILSDMDADITALANQLAKARQIKQGMMQELLTGRIRLV